MTVNPRGCAKWVLCRSGCSEPYCEGCWEYKAASEAAQERDLAERRLLKRRTQDGGTLVRDLPAETEEGVDEPAHPSPPPGRRIAATPPARPVTIDPAAERRWALLTVDGDPPAYNPSSERAR